jgi:ubiquinone/menaquinone biosynthesis C-methylase UbiE
VEEPHDHGHERRYGSGPERLRAPARVQLLEVPRVVSLCSEGIAVASVLDVGTGTGLFAEAFAGAGCAVTGVDPNEDMLAIARRHTAGVFLAATAESLPFEDASFDLVMMGHVLHETDDPAAALREARRVARYRVAVLEWPYLDEEQGPPLTHRLQESQIRAFAREAGFADIDLVILSRSHLYRLAPGNRA